MQPFQASTRTNGATTLSSAAVAQFQQRLRGSLLHPGDDGYEAGRAIYNGMIEKHPALIARCENVGDVMACVDFARDLDLVVAVRGGGHSGPGLGTCDGGLVIDLSPMNGVRVDPRSRTVQVEGGAVWGDVDHATHAFGLATVSGIVSTTGVGGLTLGGGHGYLSRRYGLTIDNLLEVDVVLADGSFVTANEDTHPDLFWALRGGGGNFGVVTSFTFRLHPVGTVVAGPMFWPIEKLEPTLRWYRTWLPQAPRDVYAFYLVAEVPGEPFPEAIHGRKVCGLMWCGSDPDGSLDAALEEARSVAEPLFEHVGAMSYPALQSMFNHVYPAGDQWYWKGDFVEELTDSAIAEHKRFAEVPTRKSTMHLYPIDGAVHDVDAGETAWRFRDANWSMVIAGVDSDPSNRARISDWARSYWAALHPHTAGASYVNFLMEEDDGDHRVRATYGENYDRLRKVKAAVDPDNLFRINQNIEPLGGNNR